MADTKTPIQGADPKTDDTAKEVVLAKQVDGIYRASRDGKQVDVTLGQTFGIEAIDTKRAKFDALQALEAPETESYAALVAWKVDAYAELAKSMGKGQSEKLAAKLAYWQGEATKLGGGVLTADTRPKTQ